MPPKYAHHIIPKPKTVDDDLLIYCKTRKFHKHLIFAQISESRRFAEVKVDHPDWCCPHVAKLVKLVM